MDGEVIADGRLSMWGEGEVICILSRMLYRVGALAEKKEEPTAINLMSDEEGEGRCIMWWRMLERVFEVCEGRRGGSSVG